MDRRGPNSGSAIDPAFLNRYTRQAKPRFRQEKDGTWSLVNVNPETFMSPMQPVDPFYQDPRYGARGRTWDYQSGINQLYTPRANSPVSFYDLRALAQNYDLLASVIETRKDQMCALDWKLEYKDQNKERDSAIDNLEALFLCPDKKRPYVTWMRKCLHEVFVTDALTIEPVFLGSGEFYALKQLDGTLIKPVVDWDGDIPDPIGPDGQKQPAYQQILKGLPVADFAADELIYWPRNQRINHLYGFSPVEQIIVSVNIALRRQVFQLDYYRAGSIPDAMVGVPDTWTAEHILLIQKFWDAQFDDPQGANLAERRKLKFMPGGKVTFAKDAQLKDEYDEWLARIVCYAFSVEPTPFIKQVNRSTSENQKQQSREEGLMPLKKWWKSLMDFIIATYLKRPDVVFAWDEDETTDPATAAEIELNRAKTEDVRLKNGSTSIDEIREERDLEPLPNGDGKEYLIYTGQGAELIEDVLEPPEPAPMPGQIPGVTQVNGPVAQKPQPVGQVGKPKPAVGKALRTLAKGMPVNAEYDIPYGFGISRDGKTLYRDKDIPQILDVDGTPVDLDEKCTVHELTEFSHCKDGDPYLQGHQKADEAEHPLVAADGVDPVRYEAVLAPYLDQAEDKGKAGSAHTPPDLATYPYEAMGTLAYLKQPAEKLAKAAVRASHQVEVQRQRLTRAVKRQLRAQATAVKEAVRIHTGSKESLHKAAGEALAASMKDFPAAVLEPLRRMSSASVRSAKAQLNKVRKDDSFGVDITDDFVDSYALDYARDRGAEMVGMRWEGDELVPNPDAEWQITDETRAGLNSLLEQQESQGWSLDELTAKIDDAYAFSGNRAEVIARTETRLADSKGQLSAWKESGQVAKKVWLVSNDGCCDDCQGNADEGEIDIDDDFPSGDDTTPGHPNCLPGSALVSAIHKVTAASKRWFDGQLVVVRTASGKEFSSTPNHPVLTEHGWVAAGALNVGSNVISYTAINREAAIDFDDQHIPSRIEEVAETFGCSLGVSAVPVPTTSEDFHGDGKGSEVAIVWANRELMDYRNITLGKQAGKLPFVVGDARHARTARRFGEKFVFAADAAASGPMSIDNLRSALFVGHPLPPERLGFAHASDGNPGMHEPVADDRATDVVAGAESQLAFPGQVALDEIISVQLKPFSGHVYNLQTESGWFVADGIVSHNCNCTIAPVVDDEE